MSFNTWTPQGTITGIGESHCGNPNVLYEGSAQILSGTVFKMWYSTVAGLYYAESTDGQSYTEYSGNPVISLTNNPYPRVWRNAATGIYYVYENGSHNGISVWTSLDGIHWYQTVDGTSGGAAVSNPILVIDQAWETGTTWFGQLNIAGKVGSTWYGYYTSEGSIPYLWQMGQATSTDLIHWTKNPANPIITQETSNFEWHTVNGRIYGWSQYGDVNGTCGVGRFSSASPAGPFVPSPVDTYYGTTSAEYVGNVLGQVCDPSLVEANGNTYLYCTKTLNGTAQTINVSVATGVTLAQLVLGYEGVVNIPFGYVPNPANNPNLENLTPNTTTIGNWTKEYTAGGWDTIQINSGVFSPASGNGAAYYNGITWPNDQWASMTAGACSGSVNLGVLLRATPGGTAYCLLWYGTFGSAGTLYIQKENNGSYSGNIASLGGITLAPGDVITGAAIGTNLYLYLNGWLAVVGNDSGYTSGKAGIRLDVGCTATAWSGGSLQAGPDNGIQGALGAGGAGATVAWTGDSSGSVTADGSGNYNTLEALLPFGSYTITPSKTGYTFSPTSASETVSGADITGINFTGKRTGIQIVVVDY
jgi:hypothetical protein